MLPSRGKLTLVVAVVASLSCHGPDALAPVVPTRLSLTHEPGDGTSGLALSAQPTVVLLDAAGRRAVVSAPVSVSLTSGTGTLVGTTTVDAVAGVARFTNLRIDGAGPHTLTFTSTGLTAAVSRDMGVVQTPARLGIVTQPGGGLVGLPLATQPKVSVLDHAGLVIPAVAMDVTATIASGAGTLGGSVTVAAVDGVAAFGDLQLSASGPHAFTFAANALPSVASRTFSVIAPPSALVVTTQPGETWSGGRVKFPSVSVVDAENNVAPGAAVPVTASIASGNGMLSGTATVNAIDGVAIFMDLTIVGEGSHTLRFSAPGLTDATSAPFAITQGPARLIVQTQPGGAVSGLAVTSKPVILFLNKNGGLLQEATGPVIATIASGSGVLLGSTTVRAVSGVASFPDLRIGGAGPHTLSFSAGPIATTSASFVVGVPPENPPPAIDLIHTGCAEFVRPALPPPLRTIYVDGNAGDDTNAGSSRETAWRTLERANASAQAGDLFLLRGTFTGQQIRPATSGTAQHKIVYRVLPGDSARVTLGKSGIAIWLDGRSHVVVADIEIDNVRSPFLLELNANDNWLFDLEVHDSGSGVILNSDDNRVEGSTFLHTRSETGQTGDALAVLDGADRNTIVRNTVRHSTHGTIRVGSATGSQAMVHDNVVSQNISANPSGSGMGLGAGARRTLVECNRIHDSFFSPQLGGRPGLEVDGLENIIRYNELSRNGFGIKLHGRTFARAPQWPTGGNLISDNTFSQNALGNILVSLIFSP